MGTPQQLSGVTPELVLLHAAVKRSGSSDVARKLGVSEGSVRGWIAGTSVPRAKACAVIREKLGEQGTTAVPHSLTRRPSKPVEKQEALTGSGVAPPTKGEVNDHDDPRANAVATLRYLRELLEDVPKERAHSIANAITACSRLLAKLTGQIDVSETMLLRSMGWARIKTSLVDAVRPYPEAARALAEAIEKLSATA